MIRHLLPVSMALIALVACGFVHGMWTDRWQPVPDPAEVAARFDALPLSVGDWQGQNVDVSPREVRGLSGYLLRRYTHGPSGQSVTVALMSGPPRVVSIHTPDACYAANGFDVTTPQKHLATALPEPTDFWTAEMVRTRPTEQMRLRIFYGWTTNGTWSAADSPRVTYAGAPTLFKLYLIREVGNGRSTPEGDPCLDLMARLQPELQRIF